MNKKQNEKGLKLTEILTSGEVTKFWITDKAQVFAVTSKEAIDFSKLENTEIFHKEEIRVERKTQLLISLSRISGICKEKYGYYFDEKLLTNLIMYFNKLLILDDSLEVYIYKKAPFPIIVTDKENVILLAPRYDEV